MRIIISPAKKMNVDCDSIAPASLPRFLDKTQQLLGRLREMDGAELKALWKCNDKIAALNTERLQNMDLRKNLTAAVLSYEGIQYKYMAPNVFTDRQIEYIGEHLRILSGFYGLLSPFDGVTPYRLEMQSKLNIGKSENLYAFWGSDIADSLFGESREILNLASKEYGRCIEAYAEPSVKFVTCIFAEETGGKLVEKGTMCKMARGEMVRYMAENNVDKTEGAKDFDRLGYTFCKEKSDESRYVFLK